MDFLVIRNICFALTGPKQFIYYQKIEKIKIARIVLILNLTEE